MGIDRRKFIKLSGLTVLSIAGTNSVNSFASSGTSKSDSSATGKRLAMVIDLKKCHEQENCEDYIHACNKIHNVPDFGNRKDEVKWIWKEPMHNAFPDADHKFLDDKIKQGPALLLCNHCDNPPCVRVCPTQATWQRKKDGIVMMDWHRCIGCRYCVVACPYGSRSFNWRDPRPHIDKINPDFPTRTRGVVEKCTFCEELLAKGQKPACVTACKYGALAFGDLEDPNSEIRELLSSRFSIRRKPGLGTDPEVYYLV